ncbi:hypothetical protein [Leclercia adecarboxylata]|uniref:hypothetical protein n=1 Tax=Leclercia adecarboxylata TaxID=83655 RepID=UPI0013C942D7|nr:hypothetical protein [Leclercia adecarboxylata]NEG94109.1 hypothetical protein [Leclercia adecarboxylata]
MKKPQKVSSWEISRFMLENGGALTAPDVADTMRRKYPDMHVEQRAVYLIMRSICFSNYSHAIVDKSVRPMTFRLVSMDSRFFKGRMAYDRMDEVSKEMVSGNRMDKEEQIRGLHRLARSCFDAMVRRRQTS